MNFDKHHFAKKVYEARTGLRMSQQEFGKAIGADKNTVFDYEKERCDSPGAENIMAICKVSGMPPNELLGWKPSRHRHIA